VERVVLGDEGKDVVLDPFGELVELPGDSMQPVGRAAVVEGVLGAVVNRNGLGLLDRRDMVVGVPFGEVDGLELDPGNESFPPLGIGGAARRGGLRHADA
jgi:hypothetical protein